ncbi:MAG TPA: CHRD domain-containing protein [Anaerolineales bacterium]|nr:CHRD domain-containing protein [Anaerolineales bacterium]
MKKTTLLHIMMILLTVLALTSLAADGGRKFTTTLTGAAEVSPTGEPNQGDPDGIGTATITLNPGQGQVCWEIQVSGITLPTFAAHIHIAPVTSPGPVVVPLSGPDESGFSSGCTSADRSLILDIIQNPENYYVNVHNVDYPAGALRGQLSK